MSISIVVSPKVKITVRGSLRNEAGADAPFDFDLLCRRIDGDEIQNLRGPDGEFVYVDFMAKVNEDWFRVTDAAKQPVTYTEDSWRALCKTPGIAALAFNEFIKENAAKEKNLPR